MAVLGDKLGSVLIKALGLPENVRWFELRCAVGEIVTVKCEYVPDPPELDENDELITALAEYTLQEKEATPCD
jgi:hypothetical protein